MQTSEDILRADQPELEDIHLRSHETESPLNPELDPAIERWHAAAADIESLLEQERKILESASARLAKMHNRIEARMERNVALSGSLQGPPKSKDAPGSGLLRKLEVSTREIAILSRLLRERERATDIAQDSARWLASVYRASRSCPSWWRFMPIRWQNRKKAERLRRQGIFDGQAYLKRYPDVAEARMDPLQHYIVSGMAEGRLR